MGVHDIRSQAARTDTGVTLRSVDRETMRVEYAGHGMTLPVDRGMESCGFYLTATPHWDDGSAVPSEDLAVVKEAIVEIQRHWGFRADFLTLEI
ncbi:MULTISPECIES: hypothetical protein [Actinoplanes]|uniref:hypothetical protein n=1 Tax=Actinoplanes TaxID=1865 RepID=UPI0005F2FB56|nr:MULTISPECIES: hypothetical protein [Actinoplanes]GLY05233.1 hypothetical protein Acsp01_56120 [Actinoplanes sp. NBRC 101535]